MRALGIALLGALSSCASTPPPAPRPPPKRPVLRSEPVAKEATGPAMLPASLVASLDDEDSSAFFARSGDGGLAWFSSKGRFLTRPTAADGTLLADPVDIGAAPPGMLVASLRASGNGYLAAWVEPVGQNNAIRIAKLGRDGKLVGEPVLLAQSPEDVSFVDVLPNESGALVLWERAHDDRYDVLVVGLRGGKATGVPATAVKDALGWEAVGTPRGAAVAAVSDVPGSTARAEVDAKLGRVTLTEIDTAGKPSPSLVVSESPTAHVDVGVVGIGNRYVVAWTDERAIDAGVFTAAIDPGGKIAVAPRRAMPAVGEQAMVSLVAPRFDDGPGGAALPSKGARGLLAWEDLLRGQGGDRLIHLATIGDDGTLGPERSTLVFSANGPPDLSADGDGFAAVTLSQASTGSEPSGTQLPIWPSFVRFGADLSVRASEPVRAEPFRETQGVPYVTRGLSCGAGTCTVLTSGAGSPAPLVVVSLPSRESPWRAPAWRDGQDSAPQATSLRSIYDGDAIARVAGAEVGTSGGSLAAWVTYFLDGASEGTEPPRRGQEPLAATLSVRPISAKGELGAPRVISQRAHSVGGVAMAAAPPGGAGEAVMAWVARDKGRPQVYVTKLDEKGEKKAQKALTVVPRNAREGVPNEASDVAIALVPPEAGAKRDPSWIVAWSDTRDGGSEIYVAKIDDGLRKVIPDRRVTDAAGDSAEVQIAVRGNDVFLVWSDSRDNENEGNADIYISHLDARTLKKIGEDTRIFASATHSRTPSISATSKGLWVGWIEEPTADGQGDGGARVAELNEKGATLGAPVLVRPAGDGVVTSVAVSCGAGADLACRGILTATVGQGLALGAFTFSHGGSPSPVKMLGGLSGGVTQDVSPSLANAQVSSIFLADDSNSGSGRVRWMTLAW